MITERLIDRSHRYARSIQVVIKFACPVKLSFPREMNKTILVVAVLAVLGWSQCVGASSAYPTMRPMIKNVFERISNVSKDAVNAARNAVHTGIDTTLLVGNAIVDRVIVVIEDFRKTMRKGIAKYSIPVLEPLTFGHADFDIKHEIGNFKGSVDDVEISNLSTFKLDSINIILLQMYLNITIPQLEVKGRYDINGKAGDMINIYGNGPFKLTIYDVSISIDTELRFHETKFSLDHLNMTMKLKKMDCGFENLMGGGDNGALFNKVCGEMAPEAIDYLWPELGPIISKKILQIFEIRLLPKGLAVYRDKFMNYVHRIQNSIMGRA